MENINTSMASPSFGALKIKDSKVLKEFLKNETKLVEEYKARTGDKSLKTPQELLGEIQTRQSNNPNNIVLYSGTSRLGYGEEAKIALEGPDGKLSHETALISSIVDNKTGPDGNFYHMSECNLSKPVSLFAETLKLYENGKFRP